MPRVLPNTTTTDDYPTINSTTGAQIGLGDQFQSGFFVVANAAAFARYAHGIYGQGDSSPDIFLPPGTYPLTGTNKDPISGIQFKSAVTGTPAQVFGVFFYRDEAQLLSSAEFTATVTPGGGITPPPVGGGKVIGEVFDYAGATNPDVSKYLFCDGSAVSRATYADLFSAIGTLWGVGDGVTTFNIPDMQGRYSAGLAGASGHVNVRTVGLTDSTSLANRRPQHIHTVTDPTHTHNNVTNRFSGAGSTVTSTPGLNPASTDLGTNSSGLNNAATGISVGTTGGGSPTVDSPPYGVLSKWICFAT